MNRVAFDSFRNDVKNLGVGFYRRRLAGLSQKIRVFRPGDIVEIKRVLCLNVATGDAFAAFGASGLDLALIIKRLGTGKLSFKPDSQFGKDPLGAPAPREGSRP